MRSRSTDPCALYRLVAVAWGRVQGGGSFLDHRRSRLLARAGCNFTEKSSAAGTGHGELTRCSLSSLRGALATKQSRISPRKDSGLLRFARNDGAKRPLHARLIRISICRHAFAFSRLFSPELCFISTPSCQRAQGRPGAGRHPRSTVRRLRYEELHSGIQVKPNIRPSLRSGLTAYAELSPGSVALLPPSPCR
ncbi:hypothetical protein B5V03_38400 [Bradyrhizobium betae]|uniref:Uncharacterized protein n=1 Tax=Bradyrhizobium betae TaxID=244734 RepID=A0A4Q1ULD7_9BRAD|nr:hypothetical protein B5V03_38400 [Bradyrhizobium betae]